MKKRIGTPGEEHVLRTLSEFEPMSLRDYQAEAGIQKGAAFERLKRVWDRKGIYIHHWERGPAGPIVPYFAIGSLPDAPKIKRKTRSESCREWREEKRISNPAQLKALDIRAREKFKERYATDPEYAEKKRTYKVEWARKKFGHYPRVLRDTLPELAIMMGSTWFFDRKKERKAA